MSLSDTATPSAGSSPGISSGLQTETSARKPSPSAVTKELIAKAAATRRRISSRLKIRVGIVCTLLVVIPIMLAGFLPLPDPNHQDLAQRLLPPLTEGHLFGTDQLGRDLLSRVLHGGQVSLTIGVLAVVVSGVLGVIAGAAAGYFGGRLDTVVSRLIEAQMSLPLLMMLLLVVALFGASIPVITFVIAIAQWPEVARLTRSMVLVEREKPYVSAARILGLHRVQILLAQAVLLESALSFLGAGPQRPFATWGRIISDGQDYITTAWWLVTLPGLVIVLMVVGVNLFGDGLRDRPRRKKKGA
jgi:peptide/nickel transport system permease protein